MTCKPTAIERAYVAQGYKPPCEWHTIHMARAEHGISERYVPLGNAPDCTAWGTPYVNGVPMLQPHELARREWIEEERNAHRNEWRNQ